MTEAKQEELLGHGFERANVCAFCEGELRSNDGHYHTTSAEYVGTAVPVCCPCIRSWDKVCYISTEHDSKTWEDPETKRRKKPRPYEQTQGIKLKSRQRREDARRRAK